MEISEFSPMIRGEEGLSLLSNQRHRAEWSAPICGSYGTFSMRGIMTHPGVHIRRSIFMTLVAWVMTYQSGIAFDDVPYSSRVGPQRIPLTSYERIPIEKVLAHPDQHQMRVIRLAGTVTAIQTEVGNNRLTCVLPHERTTLTLEDDSGQIEVIDRGACGWNRSWLKAPMLKVSQHINLLVLINIPTSSGTASPSVETTIRYIDRAQE